MMPTFRATCITRVIREEAHDVEPVKVFPPRKLNEAIMSRILVMVRDAIVFCTRLKTLALKMKGFILCDLRCVCVWKNDEEVVVVKAEEEEEEDEREGE